MKFKKFLKRAFSIMLVTITALFSFMTAYAIDLDGDGIDDDPIPSDPVVTDIYTDPIVTEAPTVPVETTTQYVEPETTYAEETTEYIEPTTEVTQAQTEAPTYVQQTVTEVQPTTFIEKPTVSKIVSEKKYETNYTAGIVSWICVGAGVLVVMAVLVSNKVSAGKANRRRV